MSTSKWLGLISAALVVGVAIGRFATPARVETKVEWQTKVETKVVTQEVVKWQTKTVIKWRTQQSIKADLDTDCTEKYSDSGQLRERRCISKSHTASSSSATGGTVAGTDLSVHSNTTSTQAATTAGTESKVTSNLPEWRISGMALAKPALTIHLDALSFGVILEKRILGSLYLGAVAIPQQNLYGMNLSLGF